MSELVYYCLSAIVLLSAMLVVALGNLVRAGLALLVCFGGVALLYFTLGAQMVAASQVLIYAVGITIVVVFAIMLLSGSLEEASEMHSISQLHLRLNRGLAFAISLLTFLVLAMAYGFHSHGIQPRIRNLVELGQGARSDLAMQEVTTRIGQHMMSEHLLAFELMSVLLLVAFVSAIAIAKRKVSYGEEEPAA